jgi:hypothetical protein
MTTDRFSAGGLALFALCVVWQSQKLPFGTFRQPGPGYVPVLLALLLLLFAVLILIGGGRAPKLASIKWDEWPHALAILAACVFAGIAIERLGYRLTLLLMLVALLKFVEKRGWVTSLIFAFSLSFGSFFLFYTILRVPLPLGPLRF